MKLNALLKYVQGNWFEDNKKITVNCVNEPGWAYVEHVCTRCWNIVKKNKSNFCPKLFLDDAQDTNRREKKKINILLKS